MYMLRSLVSSFPSSSIVAFLFRTAILPTSSQKQA
jgi:hypothetical protein